MTCLHLFWVGQFEMGLLLGVGLIVAGVAVFKL